MNSMQALQGIVPAEAVRTWQHPLTEDTATWVDVVDESQLQELVQLAGRDGLQVLPVGGGTHLPAAAVAHADLLVSLRGRAALVDHAAEDLTLVCQSGALLQDIDRVVHAAGQRLGIDCRRSPQATLGGAVAADRTGPTRLGHGTWRDHVLGARVLHSDGRITRTGSRVVKSVSGYDLAKLYVGSLGSHVFVLDINLRLFGLPQSRALVQASLPASAMPQMLTAVRSDRALQPMALLVVDVQQADSATLAAAEADDSLVVLAVFEGRDAVVEDQLQRCQSHLGGQAVRAQAADELLQAVHGLEEPRHDHALLRFHSRATRMGDTLAVLRDRCGAAMGCVAHFGVGVSHVQLTQSAWDAWCAEQRSTATSANAFWTLLHLPPGWQASPLQAPPDAALMRLQQRVHQVLDPQTLHVAPGVGSAAQPVGEAE